MTAQSTVVDLEARNAYEYLGMLIQAWEEGALDRGGRPGVLASMQSPLSGIESGLDASEQVLSSVGGARASVQGAGGQRGFTGPQGFEGETLLEKLKSGGSVASFDKDMLELFGGPNNPTKNYLEECLGCTLRLKFDWQLKPMDLLGPINGFLDAVGGALDRLLDRLDPFKSLKELCDLLNGLNILCPQDLIHLLMSLKMLLKKYLMMTFKIKLDWTTLLGPLVKLIVEGIASLLEQLLMILLAPIDCAINSISTVNKLYKEARSLVATVEAAGRVLEDTVTQPFSTGPTDVSPTQVTGGLTARDITWDPGSQGQYTDPETGERLGPIESSSLPGNQGLDVGNLKVNNRLTTAPKTLEGSFTLGTGFDVGSKTTLAEAFADPSWNQATIFDQLLIPLKEARQWLLETEESLIGSLNSLSLLVGGGLSLNLDNMGAILFVLDLISLLIMIIRMRQQYPDVRDWCEELRKHPEVLQEHLRLRGIQDVEVHSVDGDLSLRKGPDVVGTVRTCVNSRTAVDNQTIGQWIDNLRARGATL